MRDSIRRRLIFLSEQHPEALTEFVRQSTAGKDLLPKI